MALAPALVASALLLVSPSQLTRLLREDGLAESASALLLFAGALVLLATVVRRDMQPTTRLVGVAGAAILMLIGLEEVSWFQRLAGIDTPEWLEPINAQRELNFHNIATSASENLYYVGAFCLCVLARLLPNAPPGSWQPPLPCLPVCMVGAIACAATFDMWRIAHFQIIFFIAFGIIAVQALQYRAAHRPEARLLVAVAIAM
ncbi:unnamed protein product, partial [Laminaria digitata]